MSLFSTGKALKVQVYEPQGSWCSGVDFHLALRRALRERPPTAQPQVVDCLLPSPPSAVPEESADMLLGLPELRWLGESTTREQIYLHGRDPFANPPEGGELIEAGPWLCFSVHVWSRPTPSPGLVRELALARHPVVHGSEARVHDTRQARTAAEEAIAQELAAISVPTLQRARVGIREDGVIAVSGPGEVRATARTIVRHLLAEVIGRPAGELMWGPVLSSIPDGCRVVEGITETLQAAVLESEVRPYLRALTPKGPALWSMELGSGVRLVEEDPDDGATGSLQASGSMSATVLAAAVGERAHGLRRLSLRLCRAGGVDVMDLVLDQEAQIVQVTHTDPSADAGDLRSLAGDAFLQLSTVMQAVELTTGLRAVYSRQGSLVQDSSVARGSSTDWQLVWLDPLQAESLALATAVRPTTLDRPDEAPAKRARASSAKEALDEINRRLKAEGVSATMTRIEIGSNRTDAALAFADTVSPSQGSTTPRWGRCHRCEEVLQVDEAQRLPPHDWRRSPCAGSGAQVALVDAPKPAKKKTAKQEDTGGRVFVAAPAPAPDAVDDLPWGAP